MEEMSLSRQIEAPVPTLVDSQSDQLEWGHESGGPSELVDYRLQTLTFSELFSLYSIKSYSLNIGVQLLL